jgi:hypothetical protein
LAVSREPAQDGQGEGQGWIQVAEGRVCHHREVDQPDRAEDGTDGVPVCPPGSLFFLDQGEAGGQNGGEGQKGPAEAHADHLANDGRDDRDGRAHREPDGVIPQPDLAKLAGRQVREHRG